MQCPSCQHELIEIPTLEGPQLDVCPGQHGLWLDRGEINLFVENYRVLSQGSRATVKRAVAARPTLCPKCGGLLDQETVLTTALFACSACHGWWLPKGTLTQLNATARGGAAQIRFDEVDFYRRAKKRALPCQTREAGRFGRYAPRTQQVWFWTIFWSAALLFSGLILAAGLRKIVAPGPWAMPLDATWLLLALGTLAGMGLSAYGFVVNKRKGLIESIPTSTVRSLAVGLVELSGRAHPERAPLRAPFSGLPCVLYSYTVEERRQSGKETSRWEMIAKGTSEEPFYLQDETGRVLVVPFDAQLILPDKKTTRSNWSGTLPQETIFGLLKLGISVDGWLGEKTIRCSETFILPDERVYVMGTAQEHRSVGNGTENSTQLYIGSSRDNEFIISDRSERELLARLQWQLWASIGGGPALAFLCLLLMFKLYGTVQ